MFFDVLGMLVAVSYATPLFLTVVPPLGALYFYIQVRERLLFPFKLKVKYIAGYFNKRTAHKRQRQ